MLSVTLTDQDLIVLARALAMYAQLLRALELTAGTPVDSEALTADSEALVNLSRTLESAILPDAGDRAVWDAQFQPYVP